MAKSRLTIIEAKAINHYQKKHGAIAQMSAFPEVRFKIRDTGEYTSVILGHLVYEYKQDTEESQKEAANEKRRVERENRWKPTTGR